MGTLNYRRPDDLDSLLISDLQIHSRSGLRLAPPSHYQLVLDVRGSRSPRISPPADRLWYATHVMSRYAQDKVVMLSVAVRYLGRNRSRYVAS